MPLFISKGKPQIYRKGEKRKLFYKIRSVAEKLVGKGEDALCRRLIVVTSNLEAPETVFDS